MRLCRQEGHHNGSKSQGKKKMAEMIMGWETTKTVLLNQHVWKGMTQEKLAMTQLKGLAYSR